MCVACCRLGYDQISTYLKCTASKGRVIFVNNELERICKETSGALWSSISVSEKP